MIPGQNFYILQLPVAFIEVIQSDSQDTEGTVDVIQSDSQDTEGTVYRRGSGALINVAKNEKSLCQFTGKYRNRTRGSQ
jgi:hypothetical protein